MRVLRLPSLAIAVAKDGLVTIVPARSGVDELVDPEEQIRTKAFCYGRLGDHTSHLHLSPATTITNYSAFLMLNLCLLDLTRRCLPPHLLLCPPFTSLFNRSKPSGQ